MRIFDHGHDLGNDVTAPFHLYVVADLDADAALVDRHRDRIGRAHRQATGGPELDARDQSGVVEAGGQGGGRLGQRSAIGRDEADLDVVDR